MPTGHHIRALLNWRELSVQETIVEEGVYTSMFDPSVARHPGLRVDLITNSGSNDLHGSV